MQGRFIAGVGALAGCAVAACCVIPSVSDGATERHGGDHGCNDPPGTFYEDGFWPAGDNVVFGFHTDPGSFPNPDQDEILSRNTSSADDDDSTGLLCGNAVGAFVEISSNLGSGDDSVRLDANGLEPDMGDPPFIAIPKSIDAVLRTGRGDDTIRGHKGFDDINAGSGDDVIKADDGKRDIVECNGGRDKADVDNKDDVSGCEKTT